MLENTNESISKDNDEFIHGIEGRPEFLKLPFWDWSRCHSVDLMPLLGNIGARFENMVLPRSGESGLHKLAGGKRGNIPGRAHRKFGGLQNCQRYTQSIKTTSAFNGRPIQLLKAATTKSKRSNDASAVAVSKKKMSWWKDVLITKVLSAALKFGDSDEHVAVRFLILS